MTGTDGFADVWGDTEEARPDPEWLVLVTWGAQNTAVYLTFRDGPGFHPTGRPARRSTATTYRPNRAGTTQLIVPRGCLGQPSQVRVGVTPTTELTRYQTGYAPGRQQLGPCVTAGWTPSGPENDADPPEKFGRVSVVMVLVVLVVLM